MKKKNEAGQVESKTVSAKCFACGHETKFSSKDHPLVYDIFFKTGTVICQQCGLKFSVEKGPR